MGFFWINFQNQQHLTRMGKNTNEIIYRIWFMLFSLFLMHWQQQILDLSLLITAFDLAA